MDNRIKKFKYCINQINDFIVESVIKIKKKKQNNF